MSNEVKRKRHNHWLRRNHGTSIPRNLVFVETIAHGIQVPEAPRERIERLDLCVAQAMRLQNGRIERWHEIQTSDPEAFWPWLAQRMRSNASIWLIGHGIAKTFTLLDGWRRIDQRWLTLSPKWRDTKSKRKGDHDEPEKSDGWLTDGDPPTILLLFHERGAIHVVDSRNYVEASPEEMAAELGQAAAVRPGELGQADDWYRYLRGRVSIVRDYITQMMLWHERNDLGHWRHTGASNAFASYRHRFMDAKLLVHDCEYALEREREALAGGEIRLFRVGEVLPYLASGRDDRANEKRGKRPVHYGPVYHLDVNSLYPAMMRQHLYPRQLLTWKRPGELADLRAWSADLELLARVRVVSPQEAFPVLHDNERYHATGDFWTTLCGPDLARALEHHCIREVDGICAYYRGRPFTRFVDWFHQERLSHLHGERPVQAAYAKHMMNALAGKFAQRRPKWDFVHHPDPLLRWGTWPEVNADTMTARVYRAIAGYVQLEQAPEEGLESMPAITAWVTAYGRDYMRSVVKHVGAQHCFYQSTDALFVDEEGYARMRPFLETHPGELGKFRLVGRADSAEFRGHHDYTFGGCDVIAGVMSDAERVGLRTVQQWESPTLRTILTHEPGGFLRLRQIVVKLGDLHPKGRIQHDGSVLPPILRNGELFLDGLASSARQPTARRTRKPAD